MGNLVEIYNNVIKDIKDRPETPRYPTGFYGLDEVIWGLHKRELLTIGARPGQGKTSLALQMAFNVAEKNKVLFISLEMSKEQLLERILNFTCEIDSYETRRGKIKKAEWSKIYDIKKILDTTDIIIVDSLGAKASEVEALVKSTKIDFVFFDFIQMLSYDIQIGSKVIAIEEFVKKLRDIAMQYNCGMVMLSQINRVPQERRDKMPLLIDLKGSGAIEETSDTVLLCYWEWGDTKGQKGNPNTYKISIAKQRHGFIKDIEMNFEAKYFRFK